MLKRCRDPKCKSWEDYGGRGIQVKFDNFEDFYFEIGPKPSPDFSIDRINVNGNYESGNVRWATQLEQARNKRNSKAPKEPKESKQPTCSICGKQFYRWAKWQIFCSKACDKRAQKVGVRRSQVAGPITLRKENAFLEKTAII